LDISSKGVLTNNANKQTEKRIKGEKGGKGRARGFLSVKEPLIRHTSPYKTLALKIFANFVTK
jgi:hypothetical protein